ncbi:hypothetical protein WKW77_12140 [Variovorax ureilyticus]|uniref:Uncharacterized protein n=1 Tax=Variovorax ureilyticus TaxID=1836198 RepID=A0ABU8VDZ1_9BURK
MPADRIVLVGNIGREALAQKEAGDSFPPPAKTNCKTAAVRGNAMVAWAPVEPQLRFSKGDAHRFDQARLSLMMRGHSLTVEWTIAGRHRFIVGHRGWCRFFDSLDGVEEFLRGLCALKAEQRFKAPALLSKVKGY